MENEDFGFHDFESSKSNVSILVLSGYKILPNAGGWNDQFKTDAEDMLTHLNGIAWADSLKEEDNGRETGEEIDVDTSLNGFSTKDGGVEAFK